VTRKLSSVLVMLALGFVLAGCGDDGVNGSGVKSNGECASSVMDDLRDFQSEMQNIARGGSVSSARSKGREVCDKFFRRWSSSLVCTSPETGNTFRASDLRTVCDAF
jgi:hypothetical protein